MKDFFKGVLFISLILPIINGISSIFCQFVEYICTKIAVKTAEIQSIEENENKNPIGFACINDEDEEDIHEGE